jgi:hypothetical protein
MKKCLNRVEKVRQTPTEWETGIVYLEKNPIEILLRHNKWKGEIIDLFERNGLILPTHGLRNLREYSTLGKHL